MSDWSTFGILMIGILIGCLWMGLSCLACAWLALSGQYRDQYLDDTLKPRREGNVIAFRRDQ